jgi:hypothetical protein
MRSVYSLSTIAEVYHKISLLAQGSEKLGVESDTLEVEDQVLRGGQLGCSWQYRTERQDAVNTLIGSPHCLNSEFAFYTHSEHYLNITTHFRILFRIFGAHSTSSQLVRTSKAHLRNFRPILDLRSLFRKLRTSKTCIPTFRYLRTIHPDHTHLP